MKLQMSSNNFVNAPEGTTQGVLCDIVDLGMQPDTFNEGQVLHKLRLVFQTEDVKEDGMPYIVSTFPLNATLNSKSKVYGYVKKLLNRELEKSDFDGDGNADLDSLLIGLNAMITIQHKEKGERTYANIIDISPVPKQIKTRLEVKDYTRVQDRVQEGDTAEEEQEASKGGKKDKIPF